MRCIEIRILSYSIRN